MNEKQVVNMEFINDAYWLEYLYKFYNTTTNRKLKDILEIFLLDKYLLFFAETMKDNKAGIGPCSSLTKNQVIKCRSRRLKYVPKLKSDETKKIIGDMGINFKIKTWDIKLTLINNNLVDCNFRGWHYYDKDNKMLYEEIASSIKNWLKGMTKVYYEVIVREDKEKIKQSLDSVKKLKIKRKTFSSYHLFEGSLINECEKAFILFNLGKIQTIKLIETILPKENIVGNLQMHSCDFIMKIKADLIESFWELKGEGNRIVEKILNKTKYIDEKVLDFFKINRKCRSNLHYKNYKELSDTDKENLCKYQDEYLKIVISVFRSELKLKTSWGFELYE